MSRMQEVRWREKGARILGMKGRRYKLWWSGKGDGDGGVEDVARRICMKMW